MITEFYKKHPDTLLQGLFGLEKENLRVSTEGELSQKPHPSVFGDKCNNPYITTDFSESQIELITPPLPSIEACVGFMRTINDVVTEHLGDELLWPQSIPPRLPEEAAIPIARFCEAKNELNEYRRYIAEVYGRNRQMICGIHFNFSYPEEVFEMMLKNYPEEKSIDQLKEKLYLKSTRGIMELRWIIIWLFGSSPNTAEEFRVRSLKTGENEPINCKQGVSMRSGYKGYRNVEDLYLDYTSFNGYISSVNQYIEQGKISSFKELYSPLRIKFTSEFEANNYYLELRILDLDPFSDSGINKVSLYLCHILFIYALLRDEKNVFDATEQAKAYMKQDYVACHGQDDTAIFPDGLGAYPTIREEVRETLNAIEALLDEYGVWEDTTYRNYWKAIRFYVENPDERPGRVLQRVTQKGNFTQYYLTLAQKYKAEIISSHFGFHGLEDMELSTQLLLKAAICKGVRFTILDRGENFVRLYTPTKEEYVVQATKTSLDNYVSVLAMENKVVTKKILRHHHIHVPDGKEYTSEDIAVHDFLFFIHRPIVIKPKSTNFGTGITILKENEDYEAYKTALKYAFKYDSHVLVEEFIAGKEYRFLVLNDNVVGVLHRVPANVLGDGVHTIEELVAEKNKDPRRGKGYVKPLEQITLGSIEIDFIKNQNYAIHNIPGHNIKVYLRENSNISTGGDSIDFTDEVNHSYSAIAVNAARALGAKICGVDMMILDLREPAQKHNYAIIELNFNPAIHIHCVPFRGKRRPINYQILDALGF